MAMVVSWTAMMQNNRVSQDGKQWGPAIDDHSIRERFEADKINVHLTEHGSAQLDCYNERLREGTDISRYELIEVIVLPFGTYRDLRIKVI